MLTLITRLQRILKPTFLVKKCKLDIEHTEAQQLSHIAYFYPKKINYVSELLPVFQTCK